MKKFFLLAIVATAATASVTAQSSSSSQPKALWTPSKQICDPYHAEKAAEKSMSPGVKALYNASQDRTDKYINGAKAIYCNPPVTPSGTGTKTSRPAK